MVRRKTALCRVICPKKYEATHTRRLRATTAIGCTQNELQRILPYYFYKADIEQAVALLRYFNPALPGTLTTADLSTGTYDQKIFFQNVSSVLHFRNNVSTPARVKVWICTPKDATSVDPLTYFTNSLTDQTATSMPENLFYISDSIQANKTWSWKLVKNRIMQPGAEMIARHFTGPFTYDPAVADVHTLNYRKNIKSFAWVVEIEGVLSHDSTTVANVGFAEARVDVAEYRKFVIKYDAGVALNDFSGNDGADTMAVEPVVASKPGSVNQKYSEAVGVPV